MQEFARGTSRRGLLHSSSRGIVHSERLERMLRVEQLNKRGQSKKHALSQEDSPSIIRVGINGFGRLGRLMSRAISRVPNIEIVHINEPFAEPEYMVFMYNSEAERANESGPRFAINQDMTSELTLLSGSRSIRLTRLRDPSTIPWCSTDVEYVVECCSTLNAKSASNGHLQGGAKKVFIARHCGDVPIFIMGVNHQEATPSDTIISNGPRSAHCAGCLLSTLHQQFGVEVASLTILHASAGER